MALIKCEVCEKENVEGSQKKGVCVDCYKEITDKIKNIPFANSGGLNTEGLEDEDLLELQKQVDYIKKLKGKK